MIYEDLLEAVRDIPTTRVVVELHKPTAEYYPGETNGTDLNYGFRLGCKICANLYPCQTIQIIQKEIKNARN